MLMISHNHWDLLDPKWNTDGMLPWQLYWITLYEHYTGLGWNEKMSSKRLDSSYLLHWSGKSKAFYCDILIITLVGKPWLQDGLYSSYWLPYQPAACNKHGICDLNDNVYHCNCHHGYSGLTCNERQ